MGDCQRSVLSPNLLATSLCLDLLPSPSAECRFPEEFYGDWMIFSDRRKERVSIHNGHVTFSSLGEFVCKGKHWNRDEYKMLSYYSNGWYVMILYTLNVHTECTQLSNKYVDVVSTTKQGTIQPSVEHFGHMYKHFVRSNFCEIRCIILD